jgi:DNA-binding MarR family transcriptional regulator
MCLFLLKMSQQTVLNLLRKTGKPLCSREISNKLGINVTTVSENLRRLEKYQEVKFVIMNRDLSTTGVGGKALVKYFFV